MDVTHVTSSYVNVFGAKEVFYMRKLPQDWFHRNSNLAPFPMFWDGTTLRRHVKTLYTAQETASWSRKLLVS